MKLNEFVILIQIKFKNKNKLFYLKLDFMIMNLN